MDAQVVRFLIHPVTRPDVADKETEGNICSSHFESRDLVRMNCEPSGSVGLDWKGRERKDRARGGPGDDHAADQGNARCVRVGTAVVPAERGCSTRPGCSALSSTGLERHGGDRYPLSPLPEARWFSEAWLASAFLPRFRGDRLAESRTHADAVVGHFTIGNPGRAGPGSSTPQAAAVCRLRGQAL